MKIFKSIEEEIEGAFIIFMIIIFCVLLTDYEDQYDSNNSK